MNWIVRGPKVLLWHLVQRWGQAQVGFASLLSTCHQVYSLGGQLLGAVYHSPARQLRRGRDDNSLCLAACTVVKDSSSGWSHLGPKEVQVTLRSNPQLDFFEEAVSYLCYLYSVEAVSWRLSCLASALLLPPVIQQSAGCAKAEQKRRKLIIALSTVGLLAGKRWIWKYSLKICKHAPEMEQQNSGKANLLAESGLGAWAASDCAKRKRALWA